MLIRRAERTSAARAILRVLPLIGADGLVGPSSGSPFGNVIKKMRPVIIWSPVKGRLGELGGVFHYLRSWVSLCPLDCGLAAKSQIR